MICQVTGRSSSVVCASQGYILIITVIIVIIITLIIVIIMWSSLLYNSLEHTTRSVNIACLYAPLLAEVVFAAMFKLSYGELFHRASH